MRRIGILVAGHQKKWDAKTGLGNYRNTIGRASEKLGYLEQENN
jgi:hypothetical protein